MCFGRKVGGRHVFHTVNTLTYERTHCTYIYTNVVTELPPVKDTCISRGRGTGHCGGVYVEKMTAAVWTHWLTFQPTKALQR